MNTETEKFIGVRTFADSPNIKPKALAWAFHKCGIPMEKFANQQRCNWLILSVHDRISFIMDDRTEWCRLLREHAPEKYWSRIGKGAGVVNGERMPNSLDIPLSELTFDYPTVVESKLVHTQPHKESGEPTWYTYTYDNYMSDGTIIVLTTQDKNEPYNEYNLRWAIQERAFMKEVEAFNKSQFGY